MEYFDPESNEKFIPHVIEPSFGLERTVLALLASAYTVDEMKGEKRIFLKFPKEIVDEYVKLGLRDIHLRYLNNLGVARRTWDNINYSVEEYLDFYEGAGVQHIAVATDDILKTVTQLRANGVEFLSTPPEEYYKAVPGRLEEFDHELREDIEKLKALGIMIDADEEGYLLQIFTKPVEDRPTLFFEIIQRMGARGFGAGN